MSEAFDLAAAVHPWTAADLARVLRLAADGHDVGLSLGPRDRGPCCWLSAGMVPVLGLVHLSPGLAGVLVAAGLLDAAERDHDHAFLDQARCRQLAAAVDPEAQP